MMLKSYYNKKVSIIANNGQTFNGIVNDHFSEEDNESGLESIVLETSDGDLYEFTKNDIDKIIVL